MDVNALAGPSKPRPKPRPRKASSNAVVVMEAGDADKENCEDLQLLAKYV